MVANDNKAEFTGKTHKATDLQEEVEGVLKTHDISKDEWFKIDYDQKQIFGEPNAVSLKFQCEEQIKSWKLVVVDNTDDYFTNKTTYDKSQHT